MPVDVTLDEAILTCRITPLKEAIQTLGVFIMSLDYKNNHKNQQNFFKKSITSVRTRFRSP